MRGFTPENAVTQKQYETDFKEHVSAERCRHRLRHLTEEPHLAGTENSRKVAEYLRTEFESYGLHVQVYEYHVYLPYPLEVHVELVSPVQHVAVSKEDSWAWDKDSYETEIVAGYNAYSPDGDVTAELIYVNRGLPEDYQILKERGISVAGKICIARYGGSYRGVKAKVAGDNGAVGLILYSDPKDDGYMRGDVYPRGPWRSEDAIQRGTVKYIFQHASDPLTPGWAATKDAERLPIAEATDLPKIPVVPIAYRDAKPFLQALAGMNVPSEWQGGLPFAYHIGPGPAKVRIKVRCDHSTRPIYNVIATLEGTEYPDQWVILGNHHDAWVYGAADPGSGTTALLEAAQSLGELAKKGMRPKRTIVFAAWDAEEFGILGSTEWVEELKSQLQEKVIAYLNVDIAATGGRFYVSAIPSLRELIREVTQNVIDPRTLKSIYERWKTAQGKEIPQVGNLGSGSDHSPFVGHAGIPAISMGFSGAYGVYHAMQDNFYWMEHFGDPTFQYQAAMSKIWGILALRLANADVLPFDYETYATDLMTPVKLLQNSGSESKIAQGVKTLDGLLTEWQQAAGLLNQALVRYLASDDLSRISEINQRLYQLERRLTSETGLSLRPWFKHLIYAPGLNTGYAAVVFPGVEDAIAYGEDAEVHAEIDRLVAAFTRMIQGINEIREML
ncbi:M28 family metallopeptidase [Candidatus Poribacteria bacterium]|nr:M28 family metallopeptidase [Candidatus Poribacteria bacterium]